MLNVLYCSVELVENVWLGQTTAKAEGELWSQRK